MCACRFAFGFLIFVVAYVCWLLVKYYQSYVILRQHYLMGGEKQINEWHQQFLDNQKAEGAADKPSSRTRSRRTVFSEINRVFNPNAQARPCQACPRTPKLRMGSDRFSTVSLVEQPLQTMSGYCPSGVCMLAS